MIELLCSKKRMILFIIFLGLLTILLLILEEALASQEHTPTPTPITLADKNIEKLKNLENQSLDVEKIPEKPLSSTYLSDNSGCWSKETFTIVKACAPCTHFEINSKSPAACVQTGLKESVNCSITGLVFRSCSRVPDVEKQRFIIFESVMLLVAVLSYGFVKLRTSQLERAAAKQIEKRLATSY